MVIPKCKDKLLKYDKIQDIPDYWIKEEEWRLSIYRKWRDMWERVKNDSAYNDCIICHNYIRLSNYFIDIIKLENFDLFKENPKGWSIDKDIKIPGNREYKFEALSLVTRSDNSKDMRARNKTPNPRKPIIGISINDNSIIIFDFIRQSEGKGFDPRNIVKCLKGIRKSHKGYKWYYLNIIEL